MCNFYLYLKLNSSPEDGIQRQKKRIQTFSFCITDLIITLVFVLQI